MSREQMIAFALFVLRASEEARTHGGLVREAEMLVDDYLKREAA